MKKQKRDMKPRMHHRTGFLFRILTMAALALAATCCMTLFFQVDEIKVRGNNLYTAEEVAAASGISTGDSMVAIQKANAASQIRSTLPFVSRVHIERSLPGTVEITITESEVSFAFRAQDQNWYLMSDDGVIVDEIQSVHAPDYPNVTGIVVSNPQKGASIGSDSQSKAAAISIMQLLTRFGLQGETNTIDVSETHNILLDYGTLYDVQLGTTENLDHKIEYLAAVLRRLAADGNTAAGVIDLTFTEENTARFDPY